MAFEQIHGADEIMAKLRKLPERIGRNAMRRALRKGANVIRDAARNNAKRFDDPETSEQIWKNVTTQGGGWKMERQMGGPVMRVGVMGGAKNYKRKEGSYHVGGSANNPGGDTWYWRLLEFGTSKMRAQPFMRPAASEKAGAAFDAIAKAMPAELDKELRKL